MESIPALNKTLARWPFKQVNRQRSINSRCTPNSKRSWNWPINNSKLCQPNLPQNAATYKRQRGEITYCRSLQFFLTGGKLLLLPLVRDRVIPETSWVLGFKSAAAVEKCAFKARKIIQYAKNLANNEVKSLVQLAPKPIFGWFWV